MRSPYATEAQDVNEPNSKGPKWTVARQLVNLSEEIAI
jgi:hypothetical protein